MAQIEIGQDQFVLEGREFRRQLTVEASLKEVIPILEAVRYTAGLRGNQLERLAHAKEAVASAQKTEPR